ncbi:MAG: glycosyltransferase family 4 protein [Actinomycetota bacterium]
MLEPHVILLTTHAERIGGVERATRTLIRALVELLGRERVGLLSVWAQTESQPCSVLYGGRGRNGRRVGVLARALFAAHTLRSAWRWREDGVVLACHPHLAPVALLARWLFHTPCVVWCHGEEVWGTLRPAVRTAIRRADIVLAPSAFTARRVEFTSGLRHGSVRVLPHCLPPELGRLADLPRARSSTNVLTVARLAREHRYKGVDRLILAWPRVLEEVAAARLLIVGDGPDRPRLEDLARDTGVAHALTFTGAARDADLESYYSTSSIFALPSRTSFDPPQGEGFGLVYVEAGAAGLGIVAERAGAIPEVVTDGETGVLVDPSRPEELPTAIIRLLKDPVLVRRLGRNARHRSLTAFSYDRFRSDIESLLRDLIQLRRKG